MSIRTICQNLAFTALGCAALMATDTGVMRIRVLATGEKGIVGDLALNEWKLMVGGKEAKIQSQRTPQDLSKEGQKWAFVLLPIRDAEIRQLALHALAEFMKTLPASDSVLLVMRTEKGLESLTPGFTTRPTLWAKALDRVAKELPARLTGAPAPTFVLSPTPTGEAPEGIESIQAFSDRLAATAPKMTAPDNSGRRQSIMADYPAAELGGITRVATKALNSLEVLGEELAKVPGEKHLVVFSRNEVDDLANPIWNRSVRGLSSGTSGRNDLGFTAGGFMSGGAGVGNSRGDNPQLQVELMIRDITLALESLKAKYAALELTLHSVAGAGESYKGALAATAASTGGFNFYFGQGLSNQFSQVLPMWASRYELSVVLPSGQSRPASIGVTVPRKGVRIFSPAIQ